MVGIINKFDFVILHQGLLVYLEFSCILFICLLFFFIFVYVNHFFAFLNSLLFWKPTDLILLVKLMR